MKSLPEWGLALAAVALFAYGFDWQGTESQAFVPGPRTPGVLRVVTWNVGHPVRGGGARLPDFHVDEVRAALEALDPDLVFLQEVGSCDQAHRLAAGLGSRAKTVCDPDANMAILARRGRLDELPSASIGPRPALFVRYRRRGFPDIFAAGVHASAFSSVDRNQELGTTVDALLERGGPAMLLCGDFNLDTSAAGRGDLFTDDESLDVQTYNYVAERLSDAVPDGGPTAEPDRRLDYVFFGGEGFEGAEGGVVSGMGVGEMDHRPLFVTLWN